MLGTLCILGGLGLLYFNFRSGEWANGFSVGGSLLVLAGICFLAGMWMFAILFMTVGVLGSMGGLAHR